MVTAENAAEEPTFAGTGILDQLDPSHRSTTGLGTSACVTDPTAHTSSGPRATTADRIASPDPSSGVGTTVQPEPSQCCTNGRYHRPATCHPTAHASSGAITATSFKLFGSPPSFGLGTRCHVVPSHRSIKVRYATPSSCRPTAHASRGVRPATPAKASSPGPGSATGIGAHRSPFHRAIAGPRFGAPTAHAPCAPSPDTPFNDDNCGAQTDPVRALQPPFDPSAAIPLNCEPAYRVPAARTPWRTRAMPFQISLSTSVFGTSARSHPPTPAGLVVAPAALVPPAVPRRSHPTAPTATRSTSIIGNNQRFRLIPRPRRSSGRGSAIPTRRPRRTRTGDRCAAATPGTSAGPYRRARPP